MEENFLELFTLINFFFCQTNLYFRLESDIKRPSSPIEKIKSLFRKSKESMAVPAVSQPVTSSYAHHDYINFPSTASTR